jgi:putative membrane protein insertion efficiency factor
LLIAAVRAYQFTVSPFLAAVFGAQCRFYPSCSQYFIDSVKKHGPLSGAARGVWRVCRCHPWSAGGHDPA